MRSGSLAEIDAGAGDAPQKSSDTPSVSVSSDRSSVSIRLTGEGCYAEYKKAARSRDFVNSCDQAELLPATVTPDGYCCFLRGRVTLKEIVCGDETPGLRAVKALASCIGKLIVAAREHDIDARDFVFDYNAVPVRNVEADYRFLYMPGLRHVPDRTTVNDLIKIVFLNTDTDGISAADYDILRDDVRKIRPEEKTDEILEDLDRLAKRIGDLASETTFRDRIFNLFKPKSGKHGGEDPLQPLLCKVRGTGEIQDLDLERHVPRDKSISLRVGRDGDWADIPVPSLFASRKHALVEITGDGKISVQNCSLNGICVDGVATADSCEKTIRGSEVMIRITDNCGIVLSVA